MSQSSLINSYTTSEKVKQIVDRLSSETSRIHLKGLIGSSLSLVLQAIIKKTEKPFLIILNEKEEAAYYLNDLEQMIGGNDVLFYPSSYRRPYQIEETDNANVLLRSEVLNRINSRKKPAVIVTYPEALFEKVVTRKELEKKYLESFRWRPNFYRFY